MGGKLFYIAKSIPGGWGLVQLVSHTHPAGGVAAPACAYPYWALFVWGKVVREWRQNVQRSNEILGGWTRVTPSVFHHWKKKKTFQMKSLSVMLRI